MIHKSAIVDNKVLNVCLRLGIDIEFNLECNASNCKHQIAPAVS